jgi:hypothetical protein
MFSLLVILLILLFGLLLLFLESNVWCVCMCMQGIWKALELEMGRPSNNIGNRYRKLVKSGIVLNPQFDLLQGADGPGAAIAAATSTSTSTSSSAAGGGTGEEEGENVKDGAVDAAASAPGAPASASSSSVATSQIALPSQSLTQSHSSSGSTSHPALLLQQDSVSPYLPNNASERKLASVLSASLSMPMSEEHRRKLLAPVGATAAGIVGAPVAGGGFYLDNANAQDAVLMGLGLDLGGKRSKGRPPKGAPQLQEQGAISGIPAGAGAEGHPTSSIAVYDSDSEGEGDVLRQHHQHHHQLDSMHQQLGGFRDAEDGRNDEEGDSADEGGHYKRQKIASVGASAGIAGGPLSVQAAAGYKVCRSNFWNAERVRT